MSSTDDRIVRMQFDNAQFKKGAADTAKSLADLNKSVDSAGKSKGLLDMNSQMQTVGVTASKMAIITTTAIATIANKAVNAGLEMAKSLTINPIREGFAEYESLLTKQNVIMNATGLSAQEVKGYLNELNHYSDQTIYSFGNMTDSITKFVNAGVDMDTSVISIKGIANAAAFAGASTQEANRAMYAFSQSMQTGFIMLNDWMQIENANMGTIQFKEELLKAGVAAGTLTKKGDEFITSSGRAISATKGWRDGLQDQWATTEVLNTALGKYADNTTNLGKKAFESATEVRTFSAYMDTLKESIGSGWSQIFTALIGNLKQATSFWTGVSEATGAAVENVFSFGVTALKTWRKMGGFEKLMEGFKNILAPFAAILGTIGDAWKEAFPGTSSGAGKALYGLSAAFAAVTKPLQWLADSIRGATPGLTVFFKALRIGGEVVSRAAGKVKDFVTDLLGLVEIKVPPTGGFVDFVKDLAKAIANAVDEIDDLLSKGASLTQAFGAVDIKLPSMPSLPSLPSFGGSDEEGKVAGVTGSVKTLTASVGDLTRAAIETDKTGLFNQDADLNTEGLSEYGNNIKDVGTRLDDAKSLISSVSVKMGEVLKSLATNVGEFFKNLSFQDILAGLNLGVMATFMWQFIRIMKTFADGFAGFGSIGDIVPGVLDAVGDAVGALQTQAKAKLILNLGIALGILAGSLFLLSLVPIKDLGKALATLGAAMWGMTKMMNSLMDTIGGMEPDKIAKTGGVMIALGVAMMSMGVAMVFLATAFLIFNKVDTGGFIKGITTMIALMGGMTLMSKYMGENAKSLLAASVAMMAVAGSLLLLAGAMMLFALIKPETMVKAGAALGGMVVALLLLSKVPWQVLASAGLAMFGIAAGMLVLANALLIFGLVKWGSIIKAGVVLGMLTVALLLLSIAANPITVGNFMALAGAILILSVALLMLNSVSWESIGKLAVVFVVLIAAIAGLLVVLGLLAPAVVVLLVFAGAMMLLGTALLLFATAMAVAMTIAAAGTAAFAAFATGAAVAITAFFQTLAAEAPLIKDAILSILKTMIDTIVEAVPMVIQGVKRLFNAIQKEFTSPDKGKKVGDAGKGWIEKLGDAINKKIPEIVRTGAKLLISFLKGLASKMEDIAAAGVDVIVKFINGVSKKIKDVVKAAVGLIVEFAKGIEENNQRVLEAGISLIADFLHDLADAIRNGSKAIGGGLKDVIDAMKDVGVDMIQGLIGGIQDMFGSAMNKIGDLASGLANKARNILDIMSPSRVFRNIGKFLVQGLTKGIQDNAASAITAVAAMVSGQIALANQYISKFIQKLDQQAIAARGRAQGLARAALKAQKAANKTKTKEDDKAANRLSKRAEKAGDRARELEKKAQRAEKAQDRRERWKEAGNLERANIRAADAKRQIDAAKAAERNAVAAREEARALREMAKAPGLDKKQREKLRKEAERLQKIAKEEAERANRLLKQGKISAEQALKYQRLAGEEAAKSYQKQFEAEAKADEEAKQFEAMTDAEKAAKRREQAAELEKLAQENLKKAKKLAFKDIEAANALAEQAMDQAEQAREYLDEAEDLEKSGYGTPAVNLDMTELAANAFQNYSDMYDAAVAAAAATPTVEFNQYNTSPESLSPSEVYRQTRNQLNYAAEKLVPQPA